jgi:hypothetical protein
MINGVIGLICLRPLPFGNTCFAVVNGHISVFCDVPVGDGLEYSLDEFRRTKVLTRS